jgi:hypothetical protein
MAPEAMRAPALLLAAVAGPVLAGLSTDDGPRWYYVGQALLVSALLMILASRQRAAWRAVCSLGIGVNLCAAGCGVWTATGACDASTGLPINWMVLAGVALAAEIVGRTIDG